MDGGRGSIRRAQQEVLGGWVARLRGVWREGEVRITDYELRVGGGEAGSVIEGAGEVRRLVGAVEGVLVEFFGGEVETMMDVVELVDLNERERVVLGLLARGYDVAGIAAELSYGREGIYARVRTVREKLGVKTEAGAVVEGLRLGLIEMPGAREMWR